MVLRLMAAPVNLRPVVPMGPARLVLRLHPLNVWLKVLYSIPVFAVVCTTYGRRRMVVFAAVVAVWSSVLSLIWNPSALFVLVLFRGWLNSRFS